MKTIPYKEADSFRLPDPVERQRLHRVIQEELTQAQREVLVAYYFQELKIPEIARQRHCNKSVVWRHLRRAEQRLRRFLRY